MYVKIVKFPTIFEIIEKKCQSTTSINSSLSLVCEQRVPTVYDCVTFRLLQLKRARKSCQEKMHHFDGLKTAIDLGRAHNKPYWVRVTWIQHTQLHNDPYKLSPCRCSNWKTTELLTVANIQVIILSLN